MSLLRLSAVPIFVFFSNLGAAGSAHAMDDSPTAFELSLARHDLVLDRAQPQIETTVEEVGFALFDTLNPHLEGALLLGYAFANQDNAAITAGMNLNGAYGGLLLRWTLQRRAGTRASIGTEYRYYNVNDVLDDQSTRLSWHSYDVGLSLDQQLTPEFGVHLAALYGGTNGTETASGAVTQTVSLHGDAKPAGVIGLFINSANGGRIALHARTGRHNGIELIFSRFYDY